MGECVQYERIVVSTQQVDPGVQAIGSSPFAGDLCYTGIVLPQDPTPDQFHRYLCRLCGVRLGSGARGIIRSFRQMLTIASHIDSATEGLTIPLELDVTSPTWHFVDGNVSWHLRKVNPIVPEISPRMFFDVPPFTQPFSAAQYGTSACILARDATAGAYIPLNRGYPYGDGVAGLGNIHDIRMPWSQSAIGSDLGIEVVGPCELVMFASVFQTDPERRPPAPVEVPDYASLRPEDRFILEFPNARYHRIAAEMVIDMCNMGDPRDG